MREIVQQSGKGSIHGREKHALHLREIPAVRIEVLLRLLEHPRHRDKPDSRLDQSPGDEATSSKAVVTVAFDQWKRLVVERKGTPGLPGANRVERELLESFEVAFRLGGGWPLALESFEQVASAGLALCVNARGSGEAGHRIAGPPRFVEDEERIEARPQEAGVLASPHGGVLIADGARELHRGRQTVAIAAKLPNRGAHARRIAPVGLRLAAAYAARGAGRSDCNPRQRRACSNRERWTSESNSDGPVAPSWAEVRRCASPAHWLRSAGTRRGCPRERWASDRTFHAARPRPSCRAECKPSRSRLRRGAA